MTESLTATEHIETLIAKMSLAQKLGQMSQVSGNGGHISDSLAQQVREGAVGSVINEVDTDIINELQRIALEESELGIPLLIGRDVIHGFKTIFPIPLGQAASFSPDLVRQAAAVSAAEARKVGINWTFSPMVDVSRDPRWGRIAESYGEDPYLCGVFAQAMINGYQGNSLDNPTSIAACAKHFAGYGASESGRDYATTNIPENELRNVHLRPFYKAHEAGVATFMSSFGDLNGVPATGNSWLLKKVLRQEWNFKGMVVSDWDSVAQLSRHGFTENDAQSAQAAIKAGIDMEMSSATFKYHGKSLLENGQIDMNALDTAVRNILQLKSELGLFSTDSSALFKARPSDNDFVSQEARTLAKQLAIESCVLLENRVPQNIASINNEYNNKCLPIDKSKLSKIAVIGALANDPYEQLGTWVFDGEPRHSITLLDAMQDYLGEQVEIIFAKGVHNTRSLNDSLLDEAVAAAQAADIVILCVGEESILSGEAHCRANIELPGLQNHLIQALAKTQTPLVTIVMAGRPIIVENFIEYVDALLYAWHPGTMAGPALVELLFGEAIPSGRLPVTVPRHVGQIPMYYAQKPGGKPVDANSYIHMNDIPERCEQTSVGMVSAHLDVHYTPRYPFGFGLNYSPLSYSNLLISATQISASDNLVASVKVKNEGDYDAIETVQLYIRDCVGSVTRPIRELKAFKKIHLPANSEQTVSFEISSEDLMFYDINMQYKAEAGEFELWIGGDSNATLHARFALK